MIYKQWRELSVDPYKIKYKKIKLNNIISYLPAGNDVLECSCDYKDENINLILKFERSKMADFKSELNIINFLQTTNYSSIVPNIIEDGTINNKKYLVLEKKEGRRLSEIFKSKKIKRSKYIYNYGKSLAEFHLLKPNKMFKAKQRIINDIPKEKDYKIDDNIRIYIKYLNKHKPTIKYDTFIHGDYHYANLLWKYGKLSGILDFEYSGLGFKEQDIAWAIVLRPMQKFMDNSEDIKTFLQGYLSVNNYNTDSLKWCLINAYCHFYLMNINNDEYANKILKLVSNIDKFMI